MKKVAISVQITLIICITFILLNRKQIREGKSENEIKSISAPRPEVPPTLSKKYYSYEIFTKDDYMRYYLTRCRGNETYYSSKNLSTYWEKLSKGYGFIIATGERNNPMFYSVEFFNNEVLGGK